MSCGHLQQPGEAGGEGKGQQVAGENSTSPSFCPSVVIPGIALSPSCVLAAGWEVETGPQESLQHQESGSTSGKVMFLLVVIGSQSLWPLKSEKCKVPIPFIDFIFYIFLNLNLFILIGG